MHPAGGVRMRGVGAAIALTALKVALQTGTGNLYDTGRRSLLYLVPTAVMDDTCVGDTPLVPRQSAATTEPLGVDSTFDLVERAKSGDQEAFNRLFARYLPSLRRWASGRLPRWSRDLMDTDDLVQETMFRAVNRLDRFESRHP